MYCKECGAKIKDESKFCPKCGAKTVAAPPRHAAPDTRVPLIVREDASPHSRANIDSQRGEQGDKVLLVSLRETSGKHPSHESKHVVAQAVVIAAAIFVVAIAITWCTTGGFSKTASNSTVSTGNTAGNIDSDGLTSAKDGWTYYLDEGTSNGCSIRRISSEGKSESVIWSSPNATSLGYLNVIDDEAYFVSSSSSGDSICKVGLDGKNESTVWSGAGGNAAASYLSIVGNEAYFVSDDSTNSYHSICKVGTDGSNEKKILSDSTSVVGDLNIVGSEVYFVNGSSICKVGLDGKDESTVWEASGKTTLHWFNVVGSEAYFESYNSSTNNYSICKVGTDGKDEKTLWSVTNGTWPIYLDVANNEIYFSRFNSNLLYSIGTDGKDERTV